MLAVFEEWFFEDKCQAFGMSCDSGVISGQPFGQQVRGWGGKRNEGQKGGVTDRRLLPIHVRTCPCFVAYFSSLYPPPTPTPTRARAQGTFDAACFRLADIRRQGGVADEDHAGEADFHVAVENGVFTVLEVDETSAWDVCCVVVEEVATGLRAAGWSQARPFPLARTQAMREDHTGYEVGDYIADYYENVRPGFVLRSTQVTQATADALRQLCYKRSMETKLKGHTGTGTDDDGLF